MMTKTFNEHLKKIIFHIDVDAFFVSSELTLRPELKNQDIAITVGLENSIVSALSYSAKRKGAKVPMKLKEVRQYCPQIICLKPNFDLYSRLSNQIYHYLYEHYTPAIEIGSIDEWFVDVTTIWRRYQSVHNLAIHMQQAIKTTFNLEVSIGISYNKFLAKMSTDLHKPFQITITRPQDLQHQIWPLPIEKYWGIGKTLAQQLKALKITTIGDLAQINPEEPALQTIFKNQLKHYIDQANGLGSATINSQRNSLNAIGNSLTFHDGPTNDFVRICNQIKAVTILVEQRLKERCLEGKHLSLALKLFDHKSLSHSLSWPTSTSDFHTIYKSALKLLHQVWDDRQIVGIALTMTNLTNPYQAATNQSLLMASALQKPNPVQNIMQNVNAQMKKQVVVSLKEYQENKTLHSKQSKYLK